MSTKIQRNELCPCRSGKKFKKCCGNEAVKVAKHQEAWKRALANVDLHKPIPLVQKRKRPNMEMAIIMAAMMGR